MWLLHRYILYIYYYYFTYRIRDIRVEEGRAAAPDLEAGEARHGGVAAFYS
jgi:hypothetical protein